MAISIRCTNPDCGKPCRVKDDLGGKSVKCPACGQRLMIPSQKSATPADEPAEPVSRPSAPAPRQSAELSRPRAIWPWLSGMAAMLLVGTAAGYFLAPPKGKTGEDRSAQADPNTQELAAANADLAKRLADTEGKLKDSLVAHAELTKRLAANPVKKSDPPIQPVPPDVPAPKPPSKAAKIKGITDKELFSFQVEDPVRAVAFSGDGKFVLAGFGKPGLRGQAKSWNAKTGKLLQTFTGHTGHITSVAIAPDSKTVATASWDGSVKWWDAETAKCRATWHLNPTYVAAVAFSPDGRLIAGGTCDFNLKQPTYVQVWDTATGQPTHMLKGLVSHFNSLRFAGKSLLGNDASVLVQWNATTGVQEKAISKETFGGNPFQWGLDADDKTLAIYVFKKGVVLFDLKVEKELWSIPADLNTTSPLVFAPDGRTLAVGGKTGVVQFWDVPAKKEIASLNAHTDAVGGVAFSPNGELMVTGAGSGDKGLVRIWKCQQE